MFLKCKKCEWRRGGEGLARGAHMWLVACNVPSAVASVRLNSLPLEVLHLCLVETVFREVALPNGHT